LAPQQLVLDESAAERLAAMPLLNEFIGAGYQNSKHLSHRLPEEKGAPQADLRKRQAEGAVARVGE
jgi:hypothetical protein